MKKLYDFKPGTTIKCKSKNEANGIACLLLANGYSNVDILHKAEGDNIGIWLNPDDLTWRMCWYTKWQNEEFMPIEVFTAIVTKTLPPMRSYGSLISLINDNAFTQDQYDYITSKDDLEFDPSKPWEVSDDGKTWVAMDNECYGIGRYIGTDSRGKFVTQCSDYSFIIWNNIRNIPEPSKLDMKIVFESFVGYPINKLSEIRKDFYQHIEIEDDSISAGNLLEAFDNWIGKYLFNKNEGE